MGSDPNSRKKTVLQLVNIHKHNKDAKWGLTPIRANLNNHIEIVQDVNSVGVHPWDIPAADNPAYLLDEANMQVFVDELMNRVINRLNSDDNKQIKAIGECGIDKLCTAPLNVQIEVFKRHIELSYQYRLPLIIHCVKSMDEVLKLKLLFSNFFLKSGGSSPTPLHSFSSVSLNSSSPTSFHSSSPTSLQPSSPNSFQLFSPTPLQPSSPPWIWHGFRGKPQQLEQLLRAGFFVSFGYKYNKESLRACPLDRMLLETDDAMIIDDATSSSLPLHIKTVYEQVARDLCMNVDKLAEQMESNVRKFFPYLMI